MLELFVSAERSIVNIFLHCVLKQINKIEIVIKALEAIILKIY